MAPIFLFFGLILGMALSAYAQAPAISYTSAPQSYTVGTAIPSLSPISATVDAPGYGNSSVFIAPPNNYFNTRAIAFDAAGTCYYASTNLLYKRAAGSSTSVLLATNLFYVSSMVVDPFGNLFVMDNGQLKMMAAGKTTLTIVVDGFANPGQMACDRMGNLYIPESAGYYIITKIAAGSFARTTAFSTTSLGYPNAVAVDGAGTLYMLFSKSLYSYTTSGTLTLINNGFVSPTGVAVDGSGNIYVSDYNSSGTSTINKINAGGTAITTVLATEAQPLSILVDAAGNIFAAMNQSGNIDEFSPTGGFHSAILPGGITLNETTGVISGTPAAGAALASYPVTVYTAAGSASSPVNIIVGSTSRTLNYFSVSPGTLTPAYSGSTIYTVTLPDTTQSIAISTYATDPSSIVTVGGTTTTYGVPLSIPLSYGDNSLNIQVKSSRGLNISLYPLTVTRLPVAAVSYTSTAQTYTVGSAITPLAPTSSAGITAPAYNNTAKVAATLPGGDSGRNTAVDAGGNLYYSNSSTVYKLPAGTTTPVKIASGFTFVNGMTVDPAGNLYIQDANNLKMMAAGQTAVVTIASGFNNPGDIAADAAGNIYVPELNGFVVTKVAAGSFTKSTVINTLNQGNPSAIAVDGAGTLYILMTKNLYKLPLNGTLTLVSSAFVSPNGVAVDGGGNIYVSDAAYNTGTSYIRKINASDGSMIVVGSNSLTFVSASVDAAGNVYGIIQQSGNVNKYVPTGGFHTGILPGVTMAEATGIISGTPTLGSPLTNYPVTAYSTTSSASSSFNIKVNSAVASINYVTTAQGALSPAFTPATLTGYTASVSDTTQSIGITTYSADPSSAVTVNGIAGTYAKPVSVPVSLGANVIPIVVTSSDGSATKSYSITITRIPHPAIAYTATPQTFAVGTPASQTPVLTNISAPGYSSSVTTYTSLARFNFNPYNLATDAAGNMYAAFSGTIFKIPAGGGTPASFNVDADISAIALNPTGDIYGISGGGIISILPATGKPAITINQYNSQLAGSTAIAVDGFGNIYCGGANSSSIFKIDAITHKLSTLATISGRVAALAADASGNLYATLTGGSGNQIYKIPVTGTPGYFGPALSTNGVAGIAVDASGNLFVANTPGAANTGTIVKIFPDGTSSTIASGLTSPMGITLDAQGNVYDGNTAFLIQKLTPTGGVHMAILPGGLTLNETTGVISGTPTTGSPLTAYTVTAYGPTASATGTINFQVNSSNISLAYIAALDGTMVIGTGGRVYTVNVPATTTSMSFIPYTSDPSAAIYINGTLLPPGTFFTTPPLQSGGNVFLITIASSDGSTNLGYAFYINRQAPPSISYTSALRTYAVSAPITTFFPTTNTNVGVLSAGYSSTAALNSGVAALPQNLTVDTAGNLYETGGKTIYRISLTGAAPTSFSTTVTNQDALAIDQAGNRYVLDQADARVNYIAASGSPITTITNNSFFSCNAIAVDFAGNVYLASSNDFKVYKIAAGTHAVSTFVSTASFGNALGVAADGLGNVYVSISKGGISGQMILEVPVTGDSPALIGPTMQIGSAVTADASGNVYTADGFAGNAYKIYPDGSSLQIASGLSSCQGITVDGKGNVFVGIVANSSYIQELSPLGGFHSNLLPPGLTLNEANGNITGTPALGSAAAYYPVTAYNAFGSASSTVNLKVISNTATLNNVAVNGITLTPTFDPATFSYTATVPFNTATTTVTASSTDPSSAITLNGTLLTSSIASTAQSLNVGTTLLPVQVTSSDGSLTNTYNITITRGTPNLNTDLSNLTVNTGALSPVFATATTAYTASVDNTTTSIQVTPTISDSTATIQVNGNTVASGATATVSLNEGDNAIYVIVTAQDGTTTKTYSIKVSRAFPPLPTITYASQTYTTNAPISPLNPAVTGLIAAPAYAANPDTLTTTLTTPTGIAADASGNVFISDVATGKIYELASGTGAPIALSGSYNTPLAGLATDAAGNLYAAGTGNASIMKYTAAPGGITAATVPIAANSAFAVSGLAIDAAGDLFFSNSLNKTVNEIAAGTNTTVQIGGSFKNPIGLAVDVTGNVYVADPGAGEIMKIAPGSNTSTIFSTGFISPASVAIDASGNLYVADPGNDAVYKVNPDGTNPTIIATDFTGLFAVATDSKGNVYITDNGAPVVIKVRPVGGYYISNTLPAGLTISNASGVISGTPTVSSPAASYTVTGYNTGGGTSATFSLKVISADASLASLAISSGTLSPVFASATTAYSATVSNATAAITVTPVVTDLGATITVNTNPVISDSPSASLPLNVGLNTITIAVNASDGATTKTYTLNVERLAPAPVTLSYATQTFNTGAAITPLAPASTGVFAPRYNTNSTTISDFTTPLSAATDAAGNVYVADKNDIKEIFASDGHVQSIANQAGVTAIAVNASGTILYFVTPGAVSSFAVGSGTLQPLGNFTNPVAIAVDTAGSVYVADYGISGGTNGAVKKILANNASTVTLGSGFIHPFQIAVDSTGNVYVVDQGNNTLKKITPGNNVNTLASSFGSAGLAVDHNNNLYSVLANLVQMFPGGSTTPVSLLTGIGPVAGITTDGVGNIYVINVTGQNIQKFSPFGGYFLGNPLPAGLTFDSTTGMISGAPKVSTPTKNYNVTAYNNLGGTQASANITIISTDAILANLTISTGTLPFDFATTDYTVPVGAATASVTLTPTANDPGAKITVNSVAVKSDSASLSQPLVYGTNIIPVVVSASDGSTTKTYTITVIRDVPPPVISYVSGPYTYPTGTAITPINPTTGLYVDAPGYTSPATFGTGVIAPYSLAVNPQGNVYEADTLSKSLNIIGAGGGVVKNVTTAANNITGITVNASGLVFYTDGTAVYNKNSVVIASGFNATGIAADAAGNMYVADAANNAVKKIPAGGSPVNIGSGFNHPQTIAADDNGNVYVGDLGSRSIIKINAADGTTQTIATNVYAFGLAADNLGNVFASVEGNKVEEFPVGGGAPVTITSGFSAAGVVVDASGNLFVADRTNNVIQKLTLTGGYYVNNQLPAGLNADATTGIISGTPTTATAAANYNLTAINHNGVSNTATVNITVLSANNNLTNIALSDGTLAPVFAADTINYAATVPYTTSSITVTPTTSDATALVTVNSATVTSGSASASLPLNVSNNPVTIVVTAPSGSTKTYTLAVTRSTRPLPVLSYSAPQVYTQYVPVTTSTPPTQTGVDPAGYNSTPNIITSSGLSNPTYLTVDVAGNIYLGNNFTEFDKIFKSDGHKQVIANSSNVANGIHQTKGIAIDAAGNVYISYINNSSSGEISEVFASDGHIQLIATGLGTSLGIAVDDAGNIYYTELETSSVKRINAGIGTTDKLFTVSNPTSIAVDAAHNVYVETDDNIGTLYKLSGIDGSLTSLVSNVSSISSMNAMAVDGNGNIYLTGNKLYKLAVGTTSLVPVTGAAFLSVGVAVDGQGNIYIDKFSNSSVLQITPNGGYYVNKLPAGLTLDAATGSVSGTPLVVSPATDYTVTGYNSSGGTPATLNIQVTANGARLASLGINTGTLTPVFSSGVFNYSAAVTSDFISETLTPTAVDSTAIITVNGAIVASGSQSGLVNLVAGITTIPVVVKSADGTQTLTYNVNVTRPARTNADLANIILNKGVLSPVFAANIGNYTATVAWSVQTINVTPYSADSRETITVNSNAVLTGSASPDINLVQGTNTITVQTLAEDGITAKTYTIVITRLPASRNISLANLVVSPVIISPAFGTSTRSYDATAGEATSSVSITPFLVDSTQTVTINNAPAASGVANNFTLSPGFNPYRLIVFAEDGEQQSYNVTVNKGIFAPTLSYNGPQVYNVGAAITPVTPTSNDVGAGYATQTTNVASGFTLTQGVKVDAAGNVYVADQQGNTVTKIFASDGHKQTIGTGFSGPYGIALDASGNVFVTDNTSVKEIRASDGATKTIVSGLTGAEGLTLDAAGNIYVALSNASTITKIAAGTNAISTLGSGFTSPDDVALDAAGNIYVSDFGGPVAGSTGIKKISAADGSITLIENVIIPLSIAVDSSNNVYFSTNPGIFKVLPGTTTPIRVFPNLAATGMALDATGNVYISYITNNGSTAGFVDKLAVTDGYNISPVLPAGLTIDHHTGVISGTPTISSPATDYGVTVYNTGGSTTANINIKVVGNSALLSNITLSTGGLGQPFDSKTFRYDVTTPAGISSLVLTPTPVDANATVTLTYGSVVNGPVPASIPLNVGYNPIIVTVTSANGDSTHTYGVNITRAASTDPSLSALVIDQGILSPAFTSATLTGYTATVASSVSSINVTPTATVASSIIYVNSTAISQASPSAKVTLTVGANTIDVLVRAEDGTIEHYILVVTRQTGDATLSNLTISQGTLNPIFASGTTGYTASVDNADSTISVTPTANDAAATITVNGTAVSSGSASSVNLNEGDNTITTIVTASDNSTTKIYTIVVTRATSPAGTPIGTGSYANSSQTYIINRPITPVVPSGTSGALSYGSTFTPFTATRITGPAALAKDAAGNIYTSSITGSTSIIYRIPAGGGTPVQWGSANVVFGFVYGLAVDANGVVYVSNFNQSNPSQNGVYKITSQNADPILVSNFIFPLGLSIDPAGNLYVIDLGGGGPGNAFVYKIPAGQNTPLSTPVSGILYFPFGATMDASGNLYITDGIGTIYKYNASSLANTANYPLAAPGDVTQIVGVAGANSTAVDASGNLYTGGALLGPNNQVTQIAPDGSSIMLPAVYSTPINILLDQSSNLYVTDANGVEKIKPTGGFTLSPTLPAGLNFSNITGVISGTPRVLSPAIRYTLTGSASTDNVTIRVISDATLNGLVASTGTLNPFFSPIVNNYNIVVAGSVSSITLTPTLADPAASVTVNSVAVLSGQPSANQSLSVGDNIIPVVVTSADGTQTTTYTVTVTRASPNALVSLAISPGTLSPAFSSANINYTASVDNSVSSINVTPTVVDPSSTVAINGSPATSGSASSLPLNIGDNTISVVVSSPGTPDKTYTLTVNRAVAAVAAPTLAFAGPQVYTTKIAITPLTPTASGVEAPAFASPAIKLANLAGPRSVAVDAAGNIFVANRDDNTVMKIPAGGGTPVAWGSGYSQPNSVAVDANGVVYVADMGNNAIKAISPDGAKMLTIGSGFSQPTGVTVDQYNEVYVADYGNHAVKILQSNGDGTFTPFVIDDSFTGPYNLSLDHNENIYVTDKDAGAVKEISDFGNNTFTVGSGYTSPNGIVVNANGDIFITDFSNNSIKEIPASGNPVVTLGSGLSSPYGLALDAGNNLYVADNGNGSIKELSPSGGYFLNTPLPPGLVLDNINGTISGTPTLSSPAQDYTITAYNHSSSVGATVNIQVLLNPTSDATLVNLVPSAGTFNPTFASANSFYTETVPNSVSSITLTPTVNVAGEIVSIAGATVVSGSASAPLPLAVGTNTLTVLVTSQDGSSQNSINVVVTRGPQPPVVTYSPQNYAPGTVITPYLPTSSGVASLGYSNSVGQLPASLTGQARGVAVDASGTVYVSLISPVGVYKIPAGQSPVLIADNGSLNFPASLAIDKAGNVFVIDNNNTIFEIPAAGGSVVLIAKNLNDVRTLAVDDADNLYFASYSGGTVNEILAGTSNLVKIATGFNQPTGLALDLAGNIYVSDIGTGNITRIANITHKQTTIGNATAPYSVSTDIAGNVFVVDVGTSQVDVFAPDGSGLISQSNYSGASIFSSAMDVSGNLYGVDLSNPAVYTLAPNGGYFLGTKLPEGLSFDITTGGISGTPAALSPGKNYNVIAYNNGGGTAASVNIRVTNSTTNLSNLLLSNGTLTPAFAASTSNYTAVVSNIITSINVTPIVAISGSTVLVNGAAVASGAASADIPLTVGNNTITVKVTSADNLTSQTYKVVVTRLSPVPAIRYTANEVYSVGTTIAPLAPIAKAVAAPAYSNATANIGSGFSSPQSVAVDAAGNVFIADANTGSVYKIAASDGSQSTIMSGFTNPVSITVDAAGNIYVGDTGPGTITKIPANGNPAKVIANNIYANALSVDAAMNLYVSDANTAQVEKLNTSFKLSVVTSDIGFPNGVAVDAAGNVYISDENNNDIKVVPAAGGTPVVVQSGFSDIGDIKVDATGNLYAVDLNNNRVTEFPSGGGTPVIVAGLYQHPVGIAVDAAGNVYVADNGNSNVTKVTPAGGYYVAPALPAGLAINATTGIINGTPTAITPAANYNILAYNTNGGNATVTSITVKGAGSDNDLLKTLTINTGSILVHSATGTASVNYTTSVDPTTSTISLIPTAEDANATITVNGTPVASGSASGQIVLNATGTTLINLLVTAQDGTTKTYGVTISKNGSNNANLNSIKLNPHSALVAAANGTANVNYTTTVNAGANTVMVTPVAQDANATITVNNIPVVSGTQSAPILLTGNPTVINLTVTAQDGVTTKTYAIVVSKTGSNNANLTTIKLNTGTPLVKGANTSATNYTSTVSAGTASVTLTPTAQEAGSVITVNNQVVASGSASGPIAITSASTLINVVVTASDGVTVKYYTVTVTRAMSDNTNLASLTVNTGSTVLPAGTSPVIFVTSVSTTTTQITVTPTPQDHNATVTVNNVLVNSGSASGFIALPTNAETISIVVTAENGTSSKTYTLRVNKRADNVASLLSLKLSDGSAVVPVGTSTLNYTASVNVNTSSVSVIPTASSTNAVIRVNNSPVISGSASSPITLVAGITHVTILVTAADGITTKTYTIAISRAASGDADLKSVSLNTGSALTISPDGLTYTTTIDASVPSVMLTATADNPDATLKIAGNTVASGSPSGAIIVSADPTTIPIVVTAPDGTIKNYNVVITKAGSNNANLSSIKLSTATALVTASGPANVNYTTTVDFDATSIAITPIAQQPNATITVNGSPVNSGALSDPIALNGPSTEIDIVVTAQDGVTIKTYSITVNKTGSSSTACALKLSTGSLLVPAAKTGSINYTATVDPGTTNLTLTPTAKDANALIKVDGNVVASGTPSNSITLNTGPTVIDVLVTAQDGVTTKEYTVTVLRTGSSNTILSGLQLDPNVEKVLLTSSPALNTYAATVDNSVSTIQVIPTTSDANATIKVNNQAVLSGQESAAISLSAALPTVINTVVTAQDGITVKTYSITITRAPVITDMVTVKTDSIADVMPKTDLVANDNIVVHTAVSPNGDGINDFLQIDGIEAYTDNKLTIASSSGAMVYQASGYNNTTKVFDGHSSLNGAILPKGTYFYILKYKADGSWKTKSGYFVLNY